MNDKVRETLERIDEMLYVQDADGNTKDAPPSTNPDTSVDGEPTDEMVRAALTIETDEGGPISQDIGFGMMRLMLEAALAVQQKGEG